MDPCDHCEKIVQPYLDRSLSDEDIAFVDRHLSLCSWCARRFRFEAELRQYVRVACSEQMPVELKQKLADLRTAL
jgi:mycothiol system anti-sigma-R factor